MSVFGKNNSRCLSNVLQTNIIWKFNHIFRTYNQVSYRICKSNDSFYLTGWPRCFFRCFFLKTTRTLMPLSFSKSYITNWSKEVFVIKKVASTVQWTYVISDLIREEIVGMFYDKELQNTKQKEIRKKK